MLGENELSSPSQSDAVEQHFIQKENEFDKEIDEPKHDTCQSCDKMNEVDFNVVVDDENSLKQGDKVKKNNFTTTFLQELDALNDEEIRDKLKTISEQDLLKIMKDIETTNFYLSKENDLYEFILNHDEILPSVSEKIEEMDKDLSSPESLELSYSAKCHFAKKKREHAEAAFKQKNHDHVLELQKLNCELESLDKSLKDLNISKEKFDKNIRIGGRHPVTKKVIQQKVKKYFDDSIQMKRDLINRYKLQIQADIREQNKVSSLIKAQETKIAQIDVTKFKETEYEYEKICKDLTMARELLVKCKVKHTSLSQKINNLKKDIGKEESEMEQMKSKVIKQEHVKEIILSEEAKIKEKMSELTASMRKIQLDPRRHNLPDVTEYAAAKRQNAILTKSVNKWKKKVEASELRNRTLAKK